MEKVRLRLVGLDGNAFNLLGKFRVAAKFQGWPDAEIKAVTDKAMAGNYEHLLSTLAEHTEDPGDREDEE